MLKSRVLDPLLRDLRGLAFLVCLFFGCEIDVVP